MSDGAFPLLFSEFKLGNVELRNRIVWLPHLASLVGDDGLPNQRHADYYAERAKAGVGLVISGVETTHPGTLWPTKINAFDKRVVDGYRLVTDAVHRHGGRMFGQLSDDGNQAGGMETLDWQYNRAPSPIADQLVGLVPREMDQADIEESIGYFALGAAHHREGGFDGIEIKAGHDGVLRQFLSPLFNHRTDRYGGSLQNRARFIREAVEAIRARCGEDWVVGVRLCLDEGLPGGFGPEEGVEFAREIGSWGIVDYISSDAGTFGNLPLMNPDMAVPQGFAVDLGARAREASGLPVIAFGRIKEPPMAERIIARGEADLVGLARPLIADQQWAQKASEGRDGEIRFCIACNQACLGRMWTGMPVTCILNPSAGREGELGVGTLTAAPAAKRITVVGGGPAGMKVAAVAAQQGHEVALVEREPRLGGKINLLADIESRREFLDGTAWMADEVERAGVRILRGMTVEVVDDEDGNPVLHAMAVGPPATPGDFIPLGSDAIVLATGATPVVPELAGAEAILRSPAAALADVDSVGPRVLVWDEEFDQAPASVAEHLALLGREVILVTPADYPASRVPLPNLPPQLARLHAAGVRIVPHATVGGVDGGRVRIENVYGGAGEEIDGVDTLVHAIGREADDDLYRSLRDRFPDVRRAGDCLAPRDVGMAVYSGERLARAL